MNPGNDHPNDNGAPNPEQNDNNPPHEGEMNQVDNNDSIDSEASSGSELDYPTEQRILTSPVALRTSQECGGNARPITNSDLQKALAKCSTNRNPILNEMPDRDDLGATAINQAGSSGANQPGPAEEDQPGHSRNPSTVFMESGMSNFRHSALAKVLERRFGFIAQRIRENTQRLVDDPVTRPIVPMVLSPLVELGLYQIVFPHAEGPPYFYIWENSEKNETTPSQAQSAGEKKKFNPQDVDLTEIGHAEHLPQEVDEWGRLIIPLDFSEDSYVNKLGGLPLDIPPRSDITVDPRSCGPTDMQKKNPMLSNMLGLDKKPKKLVVNDPILTAMLSGPPPSWDYLISLVGTLHLEREIAMTKLRRLLLIEGYIYVRKMDPELASEWAEMDDRMYNELEQPELAMQRLHILQEVIEILKDRPALMYLWCTFDPTEEFLEVPLEKVDYSKKQIPVRPVEITVYNVTTNTKGTVQGKPSPPPSRDSSPDRQGSTEQEQDTAEEKVEDEEQEGPGTSRQNKDQQGSSDEKMDTAEDDEDDQEQEQVSAPRNEPSLDNQQPPLDNQQPQENQPIQQNVATQQNEGAQGNEPEDDNANGQIISTGAPRQPERLDEMSAKVYGKPISITDLQDALAMIYPPSPPSHQHDSNLPTLSLTLDETPMRVASGPCGKIGKRNREMRDIIRFLTQQRDNATATQNNGNPTGTGTTSRLRDSHPITAAILGKPPLPPRNRTRARPPSSDAPGPLECPHSPAKQRRLNPTSCNLQGHQRTATLGNLQVQVGSVDNVPPPGATRVNTPSKQPCRLDHRMHQGTQQSSASSTQGTQQSTAGSTQAQRDEPTDQGNRQPNQPTPHASEEVRKKLAETLKEKKEEEDEEEESPEHQPGPSEGQQGQAQTTGLQMGGQQGIRTRTLENYLEWREDVPQFSPFHVCHRARIIEIPQRRTPVRAPQDQQVLFQFRNPQVQQRPLQFRNPLTAPRPPQNINLQEQPQLAQFHPLLAQHLQRAPLPQGQVQVPQQENVQQNQPQEAEDANAENPQPQNQEVHPPLATVFSLPITSPLLEGLAVHLAEHLTHQQETAAQPVTQTHEPNPEHPSSIQNTTSRKTTKRGRPQTSPSSPNQGTSPETPLQDAPQVATVPKKMPFRNSASFRSSSAGAITKTSGTSSRVRNSAIFASTEHFFYTTTSPTKSAHRKSDIGSNRSSSTYTSCNSFTTTITNRASISYGLEHIFCPNRNFVANIWRIRKVDSDGIQRMVTFAIEEQEYQMIDRALDGNTPPEYYSALEGQMNSTLVGLAAIMSDEAVGTPLSGESQLMDNYATQQQYFHTATLPPASTLIPRSQHCQHVGVPDSDGSRHMENLPAQDQSVHQPTETTLMELYLQQQNVVGIPASETYATQQQNVRMPTSPWNISLPTLAHHQYGVGLSPSESPLMENYQPKQQHFRLPPTSERSTIQTYQQHFGELDSMREPTMTYSSTQQEMDTAELLSNADPNRAAQISYQPQQVILQPLPVEHVLPQQQTVDTTPSHISSQELNAPSEEERVCLTPILRRTLTQNPSRRQFVENPALEGSPRRYYTSRPQPYVQPSSPRSIPSQMSPHLQNMALLVSDPRMMNSATQQQHDINIPRSFSMRVLDHQQETDTQLSTWTSSLPILPHQRLAERHAAEILRDMGVRPIQQQYVHMPPPSRSSSMRVLVHRQDILSPPSTRRSSLPNLPQQLHVAPTALGGSTQTLPTQQQDDHSSPLLRSILSGSSRIRTVASTDSEDRSHTQQQNVLAPYPGSTSRQTTAYQHYLQLRRQANTANIRVASEHRRFIQSTVRAISSPKRLPRRDHPYLSSLPFRRRDEDLRSIDIPTSASSEPLVITPGDQHNVPTLPYTGNTSAHQQHMACTLHPSGSRPNPEPGAVDNTPAQTQSVSTPASPNRRVTPPQNVSAPSSAVPVAQLTTPPSGRRSIPTQYQQQLIHGSSARTGGNASSHSASRSRRSSAKTAKSLQGTPGRLVGRKLFTETDEESTPRPEDQETKDPLQPGQSLPSQPSEEIAEEPVDLSISGSPRSRQPPESGNPPGLNEGVRQSKGKYIIGKTIPKKGKKSSTPTTPSQPPPQPQNVSAEFATPRAPAPSRVKKPKEKKVPKTQIAAAPKTGIAAVPPALVVQPPARIQHISRPYVHNWSILTSELASRPVQPFPLLAGQYRRYRFGLPSPAHMINLNRIKDLIEYQLTHSTDLFLRLPQSSPFKGQRIPISLVSRPSTSAEDRPNTPPAVKRIRCLCGHLEGSPFTPPNHRVGLILRRPNNKFLLFTIGRGGNHSTRPFIIGTSSRRTAKIAAELNGVEKLIWHGYKNGVENIFPPDSVQRRAWDICAIDRQSTQTISTARIDRPSSQKMKADKKYRVQDLRDASKKEEPAPQMDFLMIRTAGAAGIPSTVGELINSSILQAFLGTSDSHTVGDLTLQEIQGTSSNEPENAMEFEEDWDSDEDSLEEEEPDFGSDYSMDEEFADLETAEEEKPATGSEPTEEEKPATDSEPTQEPTENEPIQDSEIVEETKQEQMPATASDLGQHSSPQASTAEEMSTSTTTQTIPRSTNNTPDKENDSNEDTGANTSTEDLNTSKKSNASTKSDGSRKSDASKKSDASFKSNNSNILNESNKSNESNSSKHTGSECAGESPSVSTEVPRRSTRKRKLEKENDDGYKCQYCNTAFKTEGTYKIHEWRCDSKKGQKRRRS